ncbi:DCL family protein (plasmid) [Streptomyces nojiriensis]|uniref:DCL family protein n=1 Tax=Streptomyces nojiriensis TaxID=66374 RepID=UPI002E19CB37
MPEFRIGQRTYPTKGKAQEAVRAVLHGYPVHRTVDDPEHHLLLLDLLDMHPYAEDKIGPGVEAFAIAPPPRGPHPCFQVIRTDGTRIDFSYQDCLKPRTYRQQVLNVMGDEIRQTKTDYFEARRAGGTLLSDFSGQPLDGTNTAVSYFRGPSFNEIAEEFADSLGGWEAIELTSSAEKGLGRFVDRDLAERWFIHHQDRAVFGLLSQEESRRRPRT